MILNFSYCHWFSSAILLIQLVRGFEQVYSTQFVRLQQIWSCITLMWSSLSYQSFRSALHKLLMLSSRVVVSGQSNWPVMGIVQDSLLAVQKMMKRVVFIELNLFFKIQHGSMQDWRQMLDLWTKHRMWLIAGYCSLVLVLVLVWLTRLLTWTQCSKLKILSIRLKVKYEI